MPNISDSVKKLYDLLINDPDYQDTPTKSREEVVLGEATQRAKQHARNNIALSLSAYKGSIQNGMEHSAISDLSDFLVKAKGGAPRVKADVMPQNLSNPKSAGISALESLTFKQGLTSKNMNIHAFFGVLKEHLFDILEGMELSEEEYKKHSEYLEGFYNKLNRALHLEKILQDKAYLRHFDHRDEDEWSDFLDKAGNVLVDGSSQTLGNTILDMTQQFPDA